MPKWIGDLLENATGPRLTILETQYLTPSIKKVIFKGDISKMNFLIGGASVIRVSNTDYRNYTIANYNIEKGIAEIIFNIHGNGLGSKYIDALEVGEELYVSSPRGHQAYQPKIHQHFIFGDETSLGLACSFLPVLKRNGHQFQFCFELEEENKNVPALIGLENHIVFPKNGLFGNEEWIKNNMAVLETQDWQTANFVLTGNVRSVQAFRKVLKSKKMGKIFTQGYWLEGKRGL